MNEKQLALLEYVNKEKHDHFATWTSSMIIDYLTPCLHGQLLRVEIQEVVTEAFK